MKKANLDSVLKMKKKSHLLLFGLTTLLMACSHNSAKDKADELEKLKKQQTEIKAKIAVLEAGLGANDSASTTSLGMNVSVTALKPEIFKNYIDVQGRVDADENVALSTEIPGTITKINVKVGDAVSIGQILAETDTRIISQNIADLQINMDLVNQVYQKQKNLWEQKIGTEMQYLQAKTNKESLEKKLSSLQEQLRMSKISSPISGTVDAVDIKLGQMVAPGLPAIRVVNFSNLKVKADVAESYASKIKKGSEVIIHFPDMNDTIIGNVNFVSRSISTNSRTFNVEVLLDNKKEYHPNMVARLSVNDYQSATPVLVIPVSVIQKDELNASFVFLANGNVAQKQIITLGKQYNGKSEILSGLKEGDLLISGGFDLVNESDIINYKN